MSRYIIEPRADRFAIIDTTTNKVHSTYSDAAAAGVQVGHLNRYPGLAVGAPIIPGTPPWSPIEKP